MEVINHFTFNGTSTAQLGLIVSGVSIFGAGSRKVEKAGIPGRNGDLQIELGGFNNYTVRYTVSITNDFNTTAQQIREWLLESKGYCELTDTYHPDEIRKACFNSDIEFTTSMLYKYGQASIQFDCLPERYLTTNTPITTTATADTTTDTTMSLSTVPTPINISLNGNTTQEGSSGKNLFDFTYWANNINTSTLTKTVSGNSITLTALRDDAYTPYNNSALFPKVTANTSYTFSWNVVSYTSQGEIYIFAENDTVITHIPAINNHYVTFNSGSNTVIKFRLGVLNNGGTITFNNLQFEKGSTATAYEPHISPTNPQVIHNVSGDNLITVSGNNLFDKNTTEILNAYINVNNKNIVSGGVERTFVMQIQTGNYVIKKPYYSANQRIAVLYFAEKPTIGSVGTLLINEQNNYVAFNMEQNGWIACWWFNGTVVDGNYTNALNGLYISESQFYPIYLPVENLFDRTQVPSSLVSWTYYVPNFGDNAKAYPIYIGKGKTATFKSNIPTLPSGNGFYAINALSEGSTNTLNDTHDRTISANNSGYVYVGMITSRQYYQEVIGGTYYIHVTVGDVSNVQDYSIELNKIGTYQDYIYKNGGKWYVHKETGKVDLGTLTWSYYSTSLTFMYNATLPVVSGTSSALCDAYPCGLSTDNKTFRFNGQILRIYDPDYSDASAFKTAMNGVMLYYPLATPTNTEITDTTLINQLNNIEKAYSYNGTTNILQVSNDNGFMLEVVSLHGSTFNSNYKGEPIITVNATGLIYLNGEVMEVLSAPVTINCQTMQCYNGVVNMNNEVRVNDFPEIKIGSNEVGSSMALTITPNNWRH